MPPVKGQQVPGEQVTYPAGGALAEYERVKLNSSGQVVEAGDEADIGVNMSGTVASGGLAAVRTYSNNGIVRMVAAGAIAVGDVVNAAAAGRVQSGAGTRRRGVALTATANAGETLEVQLDYQT